VKPPINARRKRDSMTRVANSDADSATRAIAALRHINIVSAIRP